MLTKKIFLEGNTIPVKQCMPQGMEIEVETVDFDNEEQTSPAFRAKRFLGILTVNKLPSLFAKTGEGSSLGYSTGRGSPPETQSTEQNH